MPELRTPPPKKKERRKKTAFFCLKNCKLTWTFVIKLRDSSCKLSTYLFTILHSNNGRFYTTVSLSVWTNLGKHFVVRLVMRLWYEDQHKTHYASGRTTFRSASFKTSSKDSSCRLVTLQVPVFILEKHNQTNNKILAQVPPDGSASSSTKTANAQPVRILGA